MFKFAAILLTLIASVHMAHAGQTGSMSKREIHTLSAEEKDRLNTLLLEAAKKGDVVEIKRLLDEGAEIDAMDELGRTPLILATSFEHYEAMKALLARFANANARSDNGDTALMLAAQYGFVEAISLLVQYGEADMNLLDANWDTAEAIAISLGQIDVIDEIARVNAEMNKLTDEMAEMNLHKKKRRFDHMVIRCEDELLGFKRPNNHDDKDDDLGGSERPSLTIDW